MAEDIYTGHSGRPDTVLGAHLGRSQSTKDTGN